MKYRKIILILLGSLLFIVLWFFTIGCISKREHVRTFADKEVITISKYDFIVIENTRYRNNEEFKAYVEERVKGTNYLKICYDEVVRLHITYLIRAWVFYEKKSTVKHEIRTLMFSQMRFRPAEDAGNV